MSHNDEDPPHNRQVRGPAPIRPRPERRYHLSVLPRYRPRSKRCSSSRQRECGGSRRRPDLRTFLRSRLGNPCPHLVSIHPCIDPPKRHPKGEAHRSAPTRWLGIASSSSSYRSPPPGDSAIKVPGRAEAPSILRSNTVNIDVSGRTATISLRRSSLGSLGDRHESPRARCDVSSSQYNQSVQAERSRPQRVRTRKGRRGGAV